MLVDPRIPRLSHKLASTPYQPLRSHSFGEEKHQFHLGQPLAAARIAAFEAEQHIDLPVAFRQFLLHAGGSGAALF